MPARSRKRADHASSASHLHGHGAAPAPPTVGPSEPAPASTEATTKPTPVPRGVKPIYVETGLASWYGPPYHRHRGANGEIYDQNSMTAAHRTLPMNSVVRVTNQTTGHAVVVRITDPAPFVEDRIIDLSLEIGRAS